VLPWRDKHLGQVGVAAVVARRPIPEQELREHCRARLAGFKVPRRFVLVDALPRNAGGKMDRTALRVLLQRGT